MEAVENVALLETVQGVVGAQENVRKKLLIPRWTLREQEVGISYFLRAEGVHQGACAKVEEGVPVDSEYHSQKPIAVSQRLVGPVAAVVAYQGLRGVTVPFDENRRRTGVREVREPTWWVSYLPLQ